MPGRNPKEKRNKEICKRYLKGESLREIGDYFHLHHSTVDEIVKRFLPQYEKAMSGK